MSSTDPERGATAFKKTILQSTRERGGFTNTKKWGQLKRDPNANWSQPDRDYRQALEI